MAGRLRQDQRTEAAKEWRKLYKTQAWQSLRLRTFQRDLYTCQMCKTYVGPSPVCDHIRDHKGNRELFHDPSNLRTLCKPCHDRHAKREAFGTALKLIGPDGWPVE